MKQFYTFNEHFNILNSEYEHLNIPLNSDLEAFICPFLIVNENDTISKKVYERSKSFLKVLNEQFIMKNDRKNGIPFLSNLSEPNEYNLGYSGNNKGKGIAHFKAEIIFDSLRNNRFAKKGVSITNEAQNVLLLVKGIGQDNMSDVLANVCRDIFSDFTEKQCNKHNVKTQSVKIDFFDSKSNKWSQKNANLPVYEKKHKILIPKNIISGARDYGNRYNWFVCKNKISFDIMNDNIITKNKDKYLNKMSNGTKKAIVKLIYKDYRKSKNDLIDFVLKYNGSLLEFQDYAKEHYPALDFDNLNNAA